VLLSAIGKKEILTILDNFPEHLAYLRGVGEQRLKTTYKTDIDINFRFPWEESKDFETYDEPDSDTLGFM
jgi:hypothetical protein